MSYEFVFIPEPPGKLAAVFLDRDGVINVDKNYVGNKANFEFLPGAIDGIKRILNLGFAPIIVTNQSGIARGKYSLDDFTKLSFWMEGVLERHGIPLAALYFCPHHPDHGFAPYLKDCDCRKPKPGMFENASKQIKVDLGYSIMIGDKNSDLLAAQAAGVSTLILLKRNGTGDFEDCSIADAKVPNLLDAAKYIEDQVKLI